MPRQPRLILPGVATHIVQRGNNRNACFRGDGDYLLYLMHLRELATKMECEIHAYCLMTNHVHLLMTPSSSEACATLMRDLGQRYVQYFNRRYGRTGTLWEGRFRSCIAESARYVLACYRYIEMNPVRAGIVQQPSQYAWSSYAANSGLRADSLVTPHAEYLALGTGLSTTHSAYQDLFRYDVDSTLLEAIRDATNGGYPLGTDEFKSRLADGSGRKIERSVGGRPRKA
jgi:putative transposase